MPDLAPNMVQPGPVQNPSHADKRDQVCRNDESPGPEFSAARDRPEWGRLSAQSNPMIAPE